MMKHTKHLLVLWAALLLGAGNAWGATKTGSWDLTSASTDWEASGNESYFSQPYGYKKVNGTLINKSITDFSTAGITEIKVGFKCLQNGATTSKITIYLVDKNGSILGNGVVVTPVNASAATKTTYQYATFTTNLTSATGFMMKVTTFKKNILVNGAEYTVTYETGSTSTTCSVAPSMDDVIASDLSTNGATLLSAITAGGDNCNITGMGFVYSSTNDTPPTIGGTGCSSIDATEDDDGYLNAVLSGLKCNTTYYVRSYATNEKGTGYSSKVEFKTLPCSSYTITWNNNGSETTTTITQDEAIGEKLPADPTSCSDTYSHFVGWFTDAAESDDSPSNAPKGMQVTAATVPTGDATYYAVFSDEQLSGELTLATSIVNGDKIYLATSPTGTGVTGADGNKDATVSTDKADWMPFTVTNYADGTFQLKNGTNYVTGASGSFKLTAEGTQLSLNNQGYFTFTSGTDTYCLLKNNGTTGIFYRCYKTSNIGQTNYTQFFMYKAGTPATGYISSCCNDKAVVTVTPSDTTINLNESNTATITLTCAKEGGGNGGTWKYSVSPSDGAPSDGASISEDGKTFTATQAGTYTVTATYHETCDKSGSATITVLAKPIVTLLDVTPPPTIVFDETNCGGNTPLNQKKSVTLQGYNLTADVKATVTGDYKIARISSTELGDYAAEVTLPKTNEGKINATYTTLYIISTPPAGTATATEGKITITTEGGDTLTVNLSTPTITCTEYTLMFMDRDGKYTTVTQYAGTEVAKPADPEGVCTDPINYVFDGWAEATVSEDSPSYTKVTFPYTMPNNNTTKLYAVYKYVDESVQQEGYFLTTEVPSAGDSVIIAAQDTKGGWYALKAASGNSTIQLTVDETNKAIATSEVNIPYQAFLLSAGTGDKSDKLALSKNDGALYVHFNSSALNVTNATSNSYFSLTADNGKFYLTREDGKRWMSVTQNTSSVSFGSTNTEVSAGNFYIFKKTQGGIPKYTSSPACGPHVGVSGDVRITSAKGVRVDAYTKISVRATNLDKNKGGDGGAATAVSIKAESDNPNFKIKRWGTTGDGNDVYSGNNKSWAFATKITDANYEDSLCITYTPTASDATESATITLTAYKYNGNTQYATNTITVQGHSLPERFVIAAQSATGWVALPNTLGSNNSATVPNAEDITTNVDNTTNPTKLTTAPSNVIYTAAARADSYKNNSQTGLRFTVDGGQFLQASKSDTKVWLPTNNAQYMQSWTLYTEDFVNYQARLDSAETGRYLAYNSDAGRIGHYKATTPIRFLPFDAECTRLLAPTNLKVTQVKSTAITLTWDAVTGATGYAYSTDGGSTWTEMGNVLTYTITGLTAEKAYTIWVKGVVPAGDTDCSYYGTVSATTTNCDDVPYDISYTSDVNSITLTWTMTSAKATVRLYSDDAGNTQVGSDYTGATSPYTIPNLDKATTYYVKILAGEGETCPSALVEVSTERPQLDVVEWYENKIDVEINTDEKISVLLENQVTKGTGTGQVANELFFSKYYEATGNVKLIAIYNGTLEEKDLTKYRISIGTDNDGWSYKQIGASDFEAMGKTTLQSNEELVLYYYSQTALYDSPIIECVNNNKVFDFSTAYLNDKIVYSGRQNFLLEKTEDGGTTYKKIDLMGAMNADGTNLEPKKGVTGACVPSWGDITKTNESYRTWCGEGPSIDQYEVDGSESIIDISMNRCLLIRKKTVLDGYNAVANNIGSFYTLGGIDASIKGEWLGRQVEQGTDNGVTSSCAGFEYVGGFDYNGYYTTYDSLMVKEFDETGRNPDGTITIEIPYLDTLSCRGLKIIASDESGHVLTTKEYRVPIIVYKSTTTADAKVFHFSEDTCKTCDVVVRPNIKLQAKAKSDGGKVEFRNMMVYAKGNFEIPNGVDFMLDNLEMHAKNDTVAYALIDGRLKVSNKITHVKRINSVTMGGAGYHFALPYPCDGTSIRQYNGNSLGEYDVDWVVFYYDGAARAETGTWNEAGTGYNGKSYWRTFPTADFELQPNVAYIIATAGINAGNSLKSVYFPPKASEGYSETTSYTEWTPDSKTVAVKAYTGAAAKLHANDRGWNFIGHPYISMFNHQTTGATGTNNDQVKMGYWEGTEYSETEKVYVNVPQNGVTSYDQDEAANLKMSPFLGYFVQVAGDADAKLTFIKNARELSAAPMMRAASVRDEHAEVALKLTAPSGEFDRTTILVDEAYTVDYEINRDLGKMARAKGLPRFYSISMEGLNEKMCYQALPSAVAENNVPLGFYAYEAGTYTIAIDSTRGDLSAVTAVALKVDGNVVHDLLSGPYTFAVSKARSTDNDSFSVSIQRKAQVTTDVNVVGNSDAVAPVVYTQGHRIHIQQLPLTGRLHIIDAVGRTIVDEQLDGCSERQYTLATDGVYVVRVATDSNVFIVKVAIR